MARSAAPAPASDPRSQLLELLASDPSLVAELRQLVEAGPDEGERAHTFEGTSKDQPLRSQTGQSVKYEVTAFTSEAGEEGPKALIVAYLPPEVATKSISVMLVAEGPAEAGRERKAKSA